MEQLWYSPSLGIALLGKWVYKKHFVFFTKKYYLVELESGGELTLESPEVLQNTCKFIGNL